MIRGIYLRANGEMACYCGPGEEVVLGQIPVDHTNYDFIEDFYKNDKHNYIRECMAKDILPYPNVCLKCIYLQSGLPSQIELLESEIEWMHIEASSNCNLNCPFCIPIEQRNTYRKKPHNLPYHLFEKVINDVASHGMKVKWMYFSGRGEASLNKDIWKMVKLAKDRLHTNFLVNTNGNLAYSDEIVLSGVDKIKIAIDGHDQETYAKYRRNGSLEKVTSFTSSLAGAKKRLGKSNPKIIWQYVLFNYNDDVASLRRFQEMAIDLGVDQVLFKTTFTEYYSTIDLDAIPTIHPNLDLLDGRAVVGVLLENIDNKFSILRNYRKTGEWHKLIPLGLEIAKNISMSFVLGVRKKQEYNKCGGSEDIDLMIEMANDRNDSVMPLMHSLKNTYGLLAEAYDSISEKQASQYYGKCEDKLQKFIFQRE